MKHIVSPVTYFCCYICTHVNEPSLSVDVWFSSGFETVKWCGKWNVIDIPMWTFWCEFSGWLSHQFAHWFDFMQTLSKGAFIVKSNLNFCISTYSSMDYVFKKLKGCSAYVKTVNAPPSPSLWLGFPRLHVAIPNQNIALHFWYPANKLRGKVGVCVCVCV